MTDTPLAANGHRQRERLAGARVVGGDARRINREHANRARKTRQPPLLGQIFHAKNHRIGIDEHLGHLESIGLSRQGPVHDGVSLRDDLLPPTRNGVIMVSSTKVRTILPPRWVISCRTPVNIGSE
jgi:hypothetical protein